MDRTETSLFDWIVNFGGRGGEGGGWGLGGDGGGLLSGELLFSVIARKVQNLTLLSEDRYFRSSIFP